MLGNREESIVLVLKSEGGYTNDAADPGGPTNWGITIFDARMYWRPGATAADVRSMPKDVAIKIYQAKYWATLNCDALPAGLDYSLFDYGVNSGIGRAGKVLRRLLGLPATTYVVDQTVLAAVAKRDVKQLITALNDERMRFLRGLGTFGVFGRGWTSRVNSVRAISLHMADHPIAINAPTPRPAGHTANDNDARGKGQVPKPAVANGKTLPTVGGVLGSIGSHFAGALHSPLFAGAAIVGGVAVGVVLWATFAALHQQKQDAATAGTAVVPEKVAA